MIEVEVYDTKSRKLGSISIAPDAVVGTIKKDVAKLTKLSFDRLSLRPDPRGKDIRNDSTVENIKTSRKIYVKDLGPQIAWKTVFLVEYAGPLFIYALVSTRPWIIYGEKGQGTELSCTAKLALICWSVHYGKRLLETLFVHRFSHGTMPLRNLFKNCSYYWGFCLYVAYHVNHPLFTPPSQLLQIIGASLFALCEVGNLSTHILLRNLRPAGSTVRKIPVPDWNLFNKLFNLVSCPNYTYEVGSWIGFTLMTSCVPAGLFTFAGFYQMAVWALGKHRNYVKEFKDYPRSRKSIVPFLL